MNRERQPQSNKFLWSLENLQEKFRRIKILNPKLLLTENRKDIEYRILFLRDVIEDGISPAKTPYFQFIIDADRGIQRDGDVSCNEFLRIFEEVKKMV